MKRKILFSIVFTLMLSLIDSYGTDGNYLKQKLAISFVKSVKAAEQPEKDNTGSAKKENISNRSLQKQTEQTSLAKRMVGKYLYEDTKSDDFFVMNVINFGNNLYAFCGTAVKEDSSSLEVYSYWASEFIPYDAEDLKSMEKDSARVNVLCFSNMSNMCKYWDAGSSGKVTLTGDGLLFENFKNFGFLGDGKGGRRLFRKDDRVEDIFPYLESVGKASDKKLEGIWMTEGDTPVFLEFKDNNMTMYQKAKDSEVIFRRAGCKYSKGSFKARGNTLGYGTMPFEMSARYQLSGNILKIRFEGDISADLSETLTFKKAKEEDIPLITMKDIELDETSFNTDTDALKIFLPDNEEYYGVFIAAFKKPEHCEKTEDKLIDAELLCKTLYTPDFSGLNPEPYYVVTAGLFTDKEEADSYLKTVKKAGFPDAYVKKAGKYKGETYCYTRYGTEEIQEFKDCFIIRDVPVTMPYMDAGQDSRKMDLVIDKNTVFDKSADLSFFDNYKKGDTAYEWFKRNYDQQNTGKNDSSKYDLALKGVFEVILEENYVKAFCNCYWWD